MSSRSLERTPGVKEFAPTPADGSEPSVNPPPIRWLAHEGVARWRVELSGPGDKKLAFGPLRDPILALRKKLAPGAWNWQFVGLDASGQEIGRGQTRTFTVRRGLSGFCAPDTARLERKWRSLRPRLFGKRIALVRQHLDGEFAEPFARLQKWCSLAEGEPPIPEPADFGPHPDDTEEHNRDWLRILSAGKVASAHAMRFALSYLLTDNAEHLALAKRWALNVLSWNPWGTTSLQICDEAGMPIIMRTAYVYDWLYQHWTPAERERFLEVMLVRGEEARERDRQVDFAARPFFNHQCRTLAFTGAAGVAFLGDIPQAAEWLQYVLDVLAVSYPSGSWGSDDGGWSQGLNYWSAYMGRLTLFVCAAAELGIDLAAAPYYRNTGYFAVYNLPPYAPGGGFGDGCGPSNRAGFAQKLVVGAFGAAAGDGHLRAYADAIPTPPPDPEKLLASDAPLDTARRWDAWAPREISSLLVSPAPGLEPRDIAELPAAREFPYIGWAAMHSGLGDPERDTWLLFKSGPFGSVSHSHADQNSFNLFAYGQPLLIDSGYYPWYGSVHDVLWTRQTWAHNAVLVGGQGQPPFDWFARGRIQGFFQKKPFCYARGEAADAYNRPPNGRALQLAEKYVPELAAKMGPATEVRRASRSVVMASGKQPYYLILDWIETAEPVRFQWLAHALEEMVVTAHGFNVKRGDARLAATFVSAHDLEITQHSQFTYRPEARMRAQPDQWHLVAGTRGDAAAFRCLTVLVPHRDGEKPPSVEPLRLEGCIGARVGRDLVLAPTSGAGGEVQHDSLRAEASLLVLRGRKAFAAEATRVISGDRELLSAAEPRSAVLRAGRSLTK
jgi:hypothetical protein